MGGKMILTEDESVLIIMADDDDDDQLLAKKALRNAKVKNEFVSLYDGQELLDYLRCEGQYSGQKVPRVGFVLLDLNMPKMDGREALKTIKEDPNLRHIPIVILTTSKAEEDIIHTYDLGCNCYIRKPVTFERMVDVVSVLGKFWIEIVEIPEKKE